MAAGLGIASIVGIVGVLLPLALRFQEYLDSRKKKKETMVRVFAGLEKELKTYVNCVEEISPLFYGKFIPLLDQVRSEYSSTVLNDLLLIYSRIIGLYGRILEAHINLAFRCKNISTIPGLMSDLNKADRILFDFVMKMKDSVINGKKIQLGEDFYTFFVSYGDEILSDINKKDINKAVINVTEYISILKNVVLPAINKGSISREIRRSYNINIKSLNKIGKRIKYDKSIVKDLEKFVPSTLRPLIPLFEELKKMENELKRYRGLTSGRNRRRRKNPPKYQ